MPHSEPMMAAPSPFHRKSIRAAASTGCWQEEVMAMPMETLEKPPLALSPNLISSPTVKPELSARADWYLLAEESHSKMPAYLPSIHS